MEEGRPITIICECGINHLGQNELIRTMIITAKECGADIVKFQLYDPEKLLDKSIFSEQEWNAILSSKLTRRQVQWIEQECERNKIELLFSVFDIQRLQWAEGVRVKRYKIAARSVNDKELCEAIVNTGKPFFVSVSDKYCKILQSWLNAPKRQRLYCVSEYPCSPERLSLPESFGYRGYYQGFSDHTTGISASLIAMARGAVTIEKHFTMDQTLPGPDQLCSIEPNDLAALCKYRDEFEKILYYRGSKE